MIDLLVIKLAVTEFGYMFACTREAGHDNILATTESELKQCREKSGDEHLIKPDLKRKSSWHTADAKYLAIIFVIICFGIYGFHYNALILFISLMGTRGSIFNISLNRKLGTDWNHVGEGKLEKHFIGRENLYFGIIFGVKIIALTWLIISHILNL